jgi:hypothetical protein
MEGQVVVDDTRLTDATGIDILPNRWYIPGPTVSLDSDDNIHVAYQDYTKHKYANNLINIEIYYMKLSGKLDCGGQPGTRTDLVLIDEQRVSTGDAHSGSADMITDSDDNVHIVWYDHRSAYWNWEIYYEKLSKNGQVLVDDMRLTYYLDYCASPEIAVDSEDNLHIAFKSYDWEGDMNYVYYMKIDDDANILVNPTMIAYEGKTSPNPYYKGFPMIVVDSEDNVHLAWHDERHGNNFELSYIKLSNDGTKLFTAPKRITYNDGSSSLQDFAIDTRDNMYFAWRDDTSDDKYQLYLAIMKPDGTFLLQPYKITVSDSLSETPSIAFDSHEYIHIAWMDNIPLNPEIYHIILKPLKMSLAFIPAGVKSGTVEIFIYKDDVIIETLTALREPGKPHESMVTSTFMLSQYASYKVVFEFTGPWATGSNNGAVPMKVYTIEDGKLSQHLKPTVVNNNSGKNPKLTAELQLDDII